ncbi:MAG TPA: hypothetical protein VIU81_09025, partial [Gaiellaceae bacterium]
MSERLEDSLIKGELVSLELDANGLTIELKIGDGGSIRLEGRVTSAEAVRIYRLVTEILQET